MPSIKAFCFAAASGDLDTIKQYIEQEGLDPNLLNPLTRKRPIDFAAQSGHLAVVQYLVAQHAKLNAQITGALYSFLYWVCRCKDSNKRTDLLAWLGENERYQQLGDGIQPAHLAAAAGENFDSAGMEMHGGLTPLYYGLLINNQNIPKQVWLSQLNVVVSKGSHKDITLAWLLAVHEEWDLLKALSKKSITPVELNAAPLNENHPQKGITLAWCLAVDEQWDLLKTLSEKSITPVELNAAPLAENDPNKGMPMTLAWWLAYFKQWDLLKALSEKSITPVELNAAPLHENHSDKGVTLAWLLASTKQWDLLKSLSEKKIITPVNLSAAPLAENNSRKGITLTQQLIQANQWALLESLLEKQCESDDADIKLTALIEQHPQEKRFHELVEFVAIKHRYKSLHHALHGQALQTSPTRTPEIQEEVTNLFQALNAASKDSYFYQAIQEQKGALLLELASYPLLTQWVATNMVHEEIERLTRMYSVDTAAEKLKVVAICALSNAGKGEQCALLVAELLNAAKQSQKQTLSALPDVESEAHDVAQPPASKRQKVSEVFEDKHAASTLFFNSPSPAEISQAADAPSNLTREQRKF